MIVRAGRRLGCCIAALLQLHLACAAEPVAWVTLTNCELVTNQDFDADSFRIRTGTNQYNVRLYFVDAPEPNLRYPDRVREQAEYFGLTLDQTLKAGNAVLRPLESCYNSLLLSGLAGQLRVAARANRAFTALLRLEGQTSPSYS